jgi:RNA polymerase sigma factor (sigma-70 family)
MPEPASLTTTADADADAPDDGVLLQRYLRGQQEAFARLYDRHDRRSFEFIRRMLAGADEATAEDLHQDLWLTVARQAASYDAAQARFVTWLFTIARNKVMDHYRKASGVVRLAGDLHPQRADTDGADDVGDATLHDSLDTLNPTPETFAQNRQLGESLLQAVQALPFVQREAFVLFAQQDLSLEAVAEITRVGLETAKSRLRYARQTLRTRLAHWRPDHG